jgi:uncharacterized protein (TIRG00374 family)
LASRQTIRRMTMAQPAPEGVAGVRARRLVLFVLKVAVTGGLIWLALRDVTLPQLGVRLAGADLGLLIAGLALLFVMSVLAGVRWQMVSWLAGAPLSHVAGQRGLFIGLFFNQTLPSSIGGDAMRIWLVNRDGAPLPAAIASVLLDRAIGLAALAWVAMMGVVGLYSAAGVGPWLGSVALVLAVAAVICFAILAWFGGRAGRWLERRSWTQPIRATAMAARRLVKLRRLGVIVLAQSLAVHLLLVAATALMLAAISAPAPFFYLLGAVPLVMLLAVAPISLGGWGVRETAMVAALAPVAVSPADSLAGAVLLGLGLLVIGLPGGIWWLLHRTKSRGST